MTLKDMFGSGNDQPPTDPPAPAPAPAADPAAPPVTAPVEPAPVGDPAATPPVELAGPAPAAPGIKVGSIVRHAYEGPAGEVEQIGQVVVVDTDNPDMTRVGVVWFAGRSGLIDADSLEVLEET